MGAKRESLFDAFKAGRYPDGFPSELPSQDIAAERLKWAQERRPNELQAAVDEWLHELAEEACEEVLGERVRVGRLATRQQVKPYGSIETVCVPTGEVLRPRGPEAN
jgi:hypothetical protein